MIQPLLCFFIYLCIQFFGMMAVQDIWTRIAGEDMPTDQKALMLITASAFCGIVNLAVFLGLRWTEVSPRWLRSRPHTTLLWVVIATLGSMIPSVWVNQMLSELPNTGTEHFNIILGSPYGFITVCVFAPLVEEVVFRGAILRSLLPVFKNHWIAIALSAVFFALAHYNPIQMPHALLTGVLLGWMYYRTGSILPGILFHWINNTVVYLFRFISPLLRDTPLPDTFSNDGKMAVAVALSLMILITSIYRLHSKMSRE